MKQNSVLEDATRMTPESSMSARLAEKPSGRKDPLWTPRRIVAVGLALSVAGTGLVFFPQAKAALSNLIEWTQSVGPLGPIYLALIYGAACVLFLPGSILTLGAGFAFGLVGGTFSAVLGSLIGVSASFVLGRTALRGWVESLTANRSSFRAIDEAVGREGFKIVLLTRLSPVFPFNLLNYGFGITRVGFKDYFFGSWIGMFPGTLLYVYFGSAAKSVADLAMGHQEGGSARIALLAVGLVATVAVTIVITRIAKRALHGAIKASNRTEIHHG